MELSDGEAPKAVSQFVPDNNLGFEESEYELYGGKKYEQLEQGQQFDTLRYENLKAMDKFREREQHYESKAAGFKAEMAENSVDAVAERKQLIGNNEQEIATKKSQIAKLEETNAQQRANLDKIYGPNAKEADIPVGKPEITL